MASSSGCILVALRAWEILISLHLYYSFNKFSLCILSRRSALLMNFASHNVETRSKVLRIVLQQSVPWTFSPVGYARDAIVHYVECELFP